MLHRLHGNSAVQSQGAGDDAARNAAAGNLGSGNSADHLLGDILHSGKNGHLGAVVTQGLCYRQGIFDDADLGVHIGIDIDGGVSDHDKAAFILENAALAHQSAATGGDEAGLAVKNGAGEVGCLQDALHGYVGLPFLHQLNGDFSGLQLLAIEVDDLIVGLTLTHVVEHPNDLGLFPDEGALHHASALGVYHGAEGGLVMGVGQSDALFHIL